MTDTLLAKVRETLNRPENAKSVEARNTAWLSTLDLILAEFKCPVGTIHQLDATSGLLHLLIRRGIPDAILDRVNRIPIGKGMAGLAAERRECVEVCNLQTDTSGDAKPGAKMTGMEGSIAVPMLIDGRVVGVLGVAKPTAYTFSDAEKQSLLAIATDIGRAFDNG